MGSTNEKKKTWLKRKKRISKRIISTVERPRLSVFRSARHIYGQIVDDTTGRTIAAASSNEKSVNDQPSFESKVAKAVFTGKLLAQRALDPSKAKSPRRFSPESCLPSGPWTKASRRSFLIVTVFCIMDASKPYPTEPEKRVWTFSTHQLRRQTLVQARYRRKSTDR